MNYKLWTVTYELWTLIRCSVLKDELLEMKARSKQSNLVFYGSAEAPKVEPDNTESKLRDFLRNELNFQKQETVKVLFSTECID